jgi:hypothetical protein
MLLDEAAIHMHCTASPASSMFNRALTLWSSTITHHASLAARMMPFQAHNHQASRRMGNRSTGSYAWGLVQQWFRKQQLQWQRQRLR